MEKYNARVDGVKDPSIGAALLAGERYGDQEDNHAHVGENDILIGLKVLLQKSFTALGATCKIVSLLDYHACTGGTLYYLTLNKQFKLKGIT